MGDATNTQADTTTDGMSVDQDQNAILPSTQEPRTYHFVSDRASRFTGEGSGHIVTPLCTLQGDQWLFRLEQNAAPTAQSQRYQSVLRGDPDHHKALRRTMGGWQGVCAALKSSYDTATLQASIDEAVDRSAALSWQYGNAIFPYSTQGVSDFNPGLPLADTEAATSTPHKRITIDTTLQPHPERQRAVIVYVPDDDIAADLTLPVESNPRFTVQCRSAVSMAGDGFEPEWRLDLVAHNPTGVHDRYIDSLHVKLTGAVSDRINALAEADDFYEWPDLEDGTVTFLDVLKDKEMEAQDYLERAIMQSLQDVRSGAITVEPKRVRAISSERTIRAYDHDDNVIFEADPEMQVDSAGQWWHDPQAVGHCLAEYKTTADALFTSDPSPFFRGQDAFGRAKEALCGTDRETVSTALAEWSAAQEAQYKAVLSRMPSVARVQISRRQRGNEMTALFPTAQDPGKQYDPSHLFTGIHGPIPSTATTEAEGTTVTAPLFSLGEKYTHRITTLRHLLLDDPTTGEPKWRSGQYDLAMANTVEVTPDGLRPHFELIAREQPDTETGSSTSKSQRGDTLTGKKSRRARPRMAPDKDPWVRGLLRTVESAISAKIGEKTGTMRGEIGYADIEAPEGQSIWLTLQGELARMSDITQEAAREVVNDLTRRRLKVHPDTKAPSRLLSSIPCKRSALSLD